MNLTTLTAIEIEVMKFASPVIQQRYNILHYGPSVDSSEIVHHIWKEVVEQVVNYYQLNDYNLLYMAIEEGITPIEMRIFISHEKWIDRLYDIEWWRV